MIVQPQVCSAAFAAFVLYLPAQTKADDLGEKRSPVLPIGSLFEGARLVLFEDLVLKLIATMMIRPKVMRANHTNLEGEILREFLLCSAS